MSSKKPTEKKKTVKERKTRPKKPSKPKPKKSVYDKGIHIRSRGPYKGTVVVDGRNQLGAHRFLKGYCSWYEYNKMIGKYRDPCYVKFSYPEPFCKVAVPFEATESNAPKVRFKKGKENAGAAKGKQLDLCIERTVKLSVEWGLDSSVWFSKGARDDTLEAIKKRHPKNNLHQTTLKSKVIDNITNGSRRTHEDALKGIAAIKLAHKNVISATLTFWSLMNKLEFKVIRCQIPCVINLWNKTQSVTADALAIDKHGLYRSIEVKFGYESNYGYEIKKDEFRNFSAPLDEMMWTLYNYNMMQTTIQDRVLRSYFSQKGWDFGRPVLVRIDSTGGYAHLPSPMHIQAAADILR